MEDRDQNIANILKHIKGLRKDIREMRKSMDSASKNGIYKSITNITIPEKIL